MATPGITELIRDLDAVLGDINDIEDRAKSLGDRMGAPVQDSHDITSRAVIARDMLREITAIVESFETGETRDRQVPADHTAEQIRAAQIAAGILSKDEAV